MEVQEVLEHLTKSSLFLEWKRKEHTSYLTTLFAVVTDNRKEWQVGYYNPHEDTMTSFVIGPTITIVPGEKILKEPDSQVRPLVVEEVGIDADAALMSAKEFQKQKYPAELPLKTLLVLQHLDLGQVYNITYVTRSFNTLNIKVDAAKGIVLQDSLMNLVEFSKK